MYLRPATPRESEILLGGDSGTVAIEQVGEDFIVVGHYGWRVAGDEFFAHSLAVWPGFAHVAAALWQSVREDARTLFFDNVTFTVEEPYFDLTRLVQSGKVKVRAYILELPSGLDRTKGRKLVCPVSCTFPPPPFVPFEIEEKIL